MKFWILVILAPFTVIASPPKWVEAGQDEAGKHTYQVAIQSRDNGVIHALISDLSAETGRTEVSTENFYCTKWAFQILPVPDWNVAGPGTVAENKLKAVCGIPEEKPVRVEASPTPKFDYSVKDPQSNFYGIKVLGWTDAGAKVFMTRVDAKTSKTMHGELLYRCEDYAYATADDQNSWELARPETVHYVFMQHICAKIKAKVASEL